MPRTCTACRHPDRAEIDAGLVRGEPYRRIAALCGVSADAVNRHKAHIPPHLAHAQQAAEVVAADDLLAQVQALKARALGILDRAERGVEQVIGRGGTARVVTAPDLRTATAAIREARGCLELLAKLVGELDERPTANVLVTSPEWLATQHALLDALRPFPEARVAVVAALRALAAEPVEAPAALEDPHG